MTNLRRNLLTNGLFEGDLNGWVTGGSASYSAGDGDGHYGVAVLPTGGGYIEQSFGVTRALSITLHVSAKPIGGAPAGSNLQAIISDGDGNTVRTINLEPSTQDDWNEITNEQGLGAGQTYTLRIINNDFGADVRVDDVWLWFVPLTRAEVATRVHAKLGRLASQRSLSTAASGSLTEGDYTYAIDNALRAVGAINGWTGVPDPRWTDEDSIQDVLDLTERAMLERLSHDYAVEVDISAGPQSRKLSQIAASIDKKVGGGEGEGGGGRVIQRRLTYGGRD